MPRWNRLVSVGMSSPATRPQNDLAEYPIEFVGLSITGAGVVSTVSLQDIREISQATTSFA